MIWLGFVESVPSTVFRESSSNGTWLNLGFLEIVVKQAAIVISLLFIIVLLTKRTSKMVFLTNEI